ncbi:MAG: helix-turn-helix domain-containing protein, partial [Oscillospiraceae bacterium]|nr:helix-turn-helix domain-containing protein [Oscillospiraceae bacterium]
MSAEKTGTQGRNAAQYTVIKVRLHPTAEQAVLMEKTFGCCRYLWNRMLSDVQEFYAATDLQYIPTPARYKKEAPFLKEVDSQALCAVHQNLRKTFLDFFRAPNSFGYPQFKTKKARKDSFTVYCR